MILLILYAALCTEAATTSATSDYVAITSGDVEQHEQQNHGRSWKIFSICSRRNRPVQQPDESDRPENPLSQIIQQCNDANDHTFALENPKVLWHSFVEAVEHTDETILHIWKTIAKMIKFCQRNGGSLKDLIPENWFHYLKVWFAGMAATGGGLVFCHVLPKSMVNSIWFQTIFWTFWQGTLGGLNFGSSMLFTMKADFMGIEEGKKMLITLFAPWPASIFWTFFYYLLGRYSLNKLKALGTFYYDHFIQVRLAADFAAKFIGRDEHGRLNLMNNIMIFVNLVNMHLLPGFGQVAFMAIFSKNLWQNILTVPLGRSDDGVMQIGQSLISHPKQGKLQDIYKNCFGVMAFLIVTSVGLKVRDVCVERTLRSTGIMAYEAIQSFVFFWTAAHIYQHDYNTGLLTALKLALFFFQIPLANAILRDNMLCDWYKLIRCQKLDDPVPALQDSLIPRPTEDA